jgi:hypothetical protein
MTKHGWLYKVLTEIGVRIVGASGNPVADEPHSRIHQGKMFSACHLVEGVANDASILLAITTPADDYPHLSVFPSCSGLAYFTIFEDVLFSGGSVVPVFNHKRYSDNEFGGTVIHTPTVLTVGAQLAEFLMPGGERNSAVGSAPDFGLEWILNNSTTYLMQLTNKSGQAASLHMGIAFYSAPWLADAT